MSNSGKILYVSDLDGTLLRSNERISDFTNEVVNSLVAKGAFFSYATARSYVTASKVTEGLRAKIPVIVYNGAFVLDTYTKEILLSNFFEKADVTAIQKLLKSRDIHPIVYSLRGTVEKFSYQSGWINNGMKQFLDSRQGDIRDNPLGDGEDLYKGQVFYLTCIDSAEALRPIYDKLREQYTCIFQKDIYSGEPWLEILPQNATKAKAIRQLQDYLGCERVISFGDGKNDISMFSISDECYAVDNAVKELKEIATGIIEGNDQDGVAKWLRENAIF